MSEKIKVSRQFLDDFETVKKFYKIPDDEVEQLKIKAREDYQSVSKSIEIIAGNIRNGFCE